MSVERSPTRSDGLDHGQAAELCLGNTAELGVIERGVEGERLFQIGDPELEVQHAHVRQTRPTTPRMSTHPQAGRLKNKFISRRRRLAVIGLAQLSSASAAVVGQSVSTPQTSTWCRMRLRHASPRLVACVCRDAGSFCRCLNRLVVGRSRVGWMHRSPCEWTVRIDR